MIMVRVKIASFYYTEKQFSCHLVFPQFSEAPCWLACKVFWVDWIFFFISLAFSSNFLNRRLYILHQH